MKKDKVYEEIKRGCWKTTELTEKLLKKMRSPLIFGECLTIREKDVAHKLFMLSNSMQYLSWAYEWAGKEYIPEVSNAIENAISVVNKEIHNLFEI